VFFDFDRDGDEDVFISNGHVIRHPINAPLMQRPVLLENREARRFVNVAAEAGPYFSQDHMGRGAAIGDLDRDGDLDIVAVPTNQPVSLLLNASPTDADWVSIKLIGTKSNRDAIGAIVILETDSGRQMRQMKGGGSYASTNEPRIHFGLGTSKFQRLEIRWPSGQAQTITEIAPNQFHSIIEPK
jgi:hypothetical protein